MRVLIAGVAGPTGRLLAERLLAERLPTESGPNTVIGLDAQACYPPIAGMRFVRAAPCQSEWTPLLREVDAAIHLGGLRWPLPWSERRRELDLVEESKFFVRAAIDAGVPKLLMLTSAALYGPQPPGPIAEPAAVRGHEASVYARTRAQVADYLDTVRYNGVLTCLRAAWLCGPHHLALVRLVASSPVRACGYEDRTLPLLHEEDLVAAVRLALRDNLAGVYNVSAEAGVSLRELAALAGSEFDLYAAGRVGSARVVALALAAPANTAAVAERVNGQPPAECG